MIRLILYPCGLALVVIGLMLGVGVYISPKDEPRPSDVIVAISGGDTQARTEEAVRLYQQGWAPRLIFSGAALDPDSPSNAEVMQRVAVAAGVPPDIIAIDEVSENTRENAAQAAEFIEAFEHKQIILVTSPYHQRRAYLEFNRRLGEDVMIINNPAPDDVWSRRGWWRTSLGWQITIREIPKVLYALTQAR